MALASSSSLITLKVKPCVFGSPRRSTVVRNCAKSTHASKSTSSSITTSWSLDSWRTKEALQLPEYPNASDLDKVLETLTSFPPIVFAGEARNLEEKLAQAAVGSAFLLQGGDCAESFKEFNANNIRDTFRVILQMGVVLMFGGQMPVIKVSFFNYFTASSDFVVFRKKKGSFFSCSILSDRFGTFGRCLGREKSEP